MATILNKKGSLFDAPPGSMLIHAVSTKSVWGSGIAKQFKARFPESFEFYKEICAEEKERLLGTFIEGPEENGYRVVNLVTSIDYGTNKDPKEKIIESTKSTLKLFFAIHKNGMHGEIHSCKFNSGLFGVPWNETEKILIEELDKAGCTLPWTVWEQ